MRQWISIRGPGGLRFGQSIGPEDFGPPKLPPSWRRHELRKGLQAAAEARGEPMTRDEADYIVDKALATGGIDSAGNLAFPVKGTREEIVGQIIEIAAAWVARCHERRPRKWPTTRRQRAPGRGFRFWLAPRFGRQSYWPSSRQNRRSATTRGITGCDLGGDGGISSPDWRVRRSR